MRIAVCRPQVPFVRGGAEVMADALVAELRTRGHEAEIVRRFSTRADRPWFAAAFPGDPQPVSLANIVRAIAAQAARMDYAPGFQMGHPLEFELAASLSELLPGDIDHVFFTNSGSEAVDSALKIALAYWQAKGEPSRTRLIGRLRGYHGVGFGGISVGGIESNRKQFASQLLTNVDHLPHTHDPARNAFARGQPAHGAGLADELETLVQRYGAATIAAVIVEPVAGSTGVLIPPKGYLERLREICTRHGILLIFDEVITGFGRLGAPFAADFFGVKPDLTTVAKGISNAAVPMPGLGTPRRIGDGVAKATPGLAISLITIRRAASNKKITHQYSSK